MCSCSRIFHIRLYVICRAKLSTLTILSLSEAKAIVVSTKSENYLTDGPGAHLALSTSVYNAWSIISTSNQFIAKQTRRFYSRNSKVNQEYLDTIVFSHKYFMYRQNLNVFITIHTNIGDKAYEDSVQTLEITMEGFRILIKYLKLLI